MTQHKVIYDTDPGVDDAMALVFQALHPDIELLGITSVYGNATISTTTSNALYLRSRFCPGVPVARGAAAPLHRAPPAPLGWIHGDNGMGNIELGEPGDTLLDERSAHRFIIDTIRAQPGEVTLIAVGPLTNLALALEADPEIATLVKQVVIMGGAFGTAGVLGNVSPAAEANIMCDPDAADIVLGAPWPVTVVGLDVTQETIMPNDWLAGFGDQGDAGRFVWDVSRHYAQFHKDSAGLEGIYVHDSSAVAYVLAPHLYTVRNGPVRVVTSGIATGETIQKLTTMKAPAPDWDDRPAQSVCIGVDAAGMLDLYKKTFFKAL
ncbi:nucleoside hydrolase [uncultured Caballeronia sp.]|jgi:inosine-uridine nucleoside N-ribohydrolase|uniref:nucleoside hydrolase n=1 Tax=uncultured Caballeronia sp. TaxID=1827198 RepID=UPI001576ED68